MNLIVAMLTKSLGCFAFGIYSLFNFLSRLITSDNLHDYHNAVVANTIPFAYR